MNKVIIIVSLLLPVLLFSQGKISVGGGAGLVGIKKETGFNGNVFAGYALNKTISIGADVLLGDVSGVETQALLGYVEGGSPKWSLDSGNKVYFSGVLGLGNLSFKVADISESAFTFFAGTKVNVDLDPKYVFGIKTGVYMSKLETMSVANLFFAYKF